MDRVLGRTAGNAVEVRESIDHLTGAASDERLREVTLALSAELLVLGGVEPDAERGARSGRAGARLGRRRGALRAPWWPSWAGPADLLEAPDRHLAAGAGDGRGRAGGGGNGGRGGRARGRPRRGGARRRPHPRGRPRGPLGRADRRGGARRAGRPRRRPAGDRCTRRTRRARGARRTRCARPTRWATPPDGAAARCSGRCGERGREGRAPRPSRGHRSAGADPPDRRAQRASSCPDGLFAAPDRFAYRDFLDFLDTYDKAASVIRTGDDYRDITYEYLVEVRRRGRDLRGAHRLAGPRAARGPDATRSTSTASRAGSTTPATRPASRAASSSPACATSAWRRRSRWPATPPSGRIPTSSASRWPATRRTTRPATTPRPSRSPPAPASAAPCTPASGRARERPGRHSSCRSPASPTASARSRIRRSWTSSPSAGSSSSAARRATSCSASTRATRSTRCRACARRECGSRSGSDDPPYFGASIGGEYEICREHFGYGDDGSARDHGDRHRGRILRGNAQTALNSKGCRVAPSLTQRGDSTVRKSFRFTLFALLAALALGIAACGATTTTAAAAAATTARATAAASPSRPAS